MKLELDSPEKTNALQTPSLRVLLASGHWIVETDTGASVSGPDDQAGAVELARQVGVAQDASQIAVYAADGTFEKTVAV